MGKIHAILALQDLWRLFLCPTKGSCVSQFICRSETYLGIMSRAVAAAADRAGWVKKCIYEPRIAEG
jgi:hypothetical protein